MKARAEASERLSSEIIASMTSGLLVVDEEGVVRTLNPAGARMLGLPRGRLEAARSARCWPAPRRSPTWSTNACAPAGRSSAARCRWTGAGRRLAPRRHGLADPRRRGAAARRHLPVHRPQRGDGARRAAAAEGQPGAARRADRRHRARVPQRARDHPRLRPAAGSRPAAAGVPAVRRRASATRPRRSARSSRTSSTSPSPPS